MNKIQPSRAAKMAQNIEEQLNKQSKKEPVPPYVPTKPANLDKDTPEMRNKRRLAVEKMQTFLD